MTNQEAIRYLNGLNNHLESEAIPGALTKALNSPQKVPFGLYAEQLSGSAFTVTRHNNLHSWLYRIRPSVIHGEFTPFIQPHWQHHSPTDFITPPMQMRWHPMPYPNKKTDFIQGLITIAHHGASDSHTGAAIHLYAINHSMENTFFYNADGELLIVAQEGQLIFKTEFGLLELNPGEILVIQRGIKFQVQLKSDKARGYICENFGAPFQLPELGLIGANGLAHPRHFQLPQASFEQLNDDFTLIVKFHGNLWQTKLKHSPLDVVAWHGTYVPYKYNLHLFNTINTVSFDHPDPSIFTVLTSPSHDTGIANVDFVIFPPRWMVAENTFRPPYFHRNVMSEYMGLIKGVYDAKENGFMPFGSSLHNSMCPHGPDKAAYDKAVKKDLIPEYYNDTLAFMFESRYIWQVTRYAYEADFRQKDYLQCWQGLKPQFSLAT